MTTKVSDAKPLVLNAKYGGAIRIYTTSNIHICRQLGFWYDTKVLYQYTPSKGFGFVVITDSLAPSLSESLGAWAIFAPTGLWLSWESEKEVEQVSIPLERGIAWYNQEGRTWEHVKR
jgi:hypothetical protein